MTAGPTLPDELDAESGRELVSLARDAIANPAGDDRPSRSVEGEAPATFGGAFVTLERGDRLRGCCGRIDAEEPLRRVVRSSAIAAAREDPRCATVEPAEMDAVTVVVTVLSEPVVAPVDSADALPEAISVGRNGLLVTRGPSRGVLLPQVAVDHDLNAREFLAAACRKAGLPGDAWRRDGVDVARFTGRAFAERRPGGEVDVRRYDRPTADGWST
ncbi:MAG: AmmeMemoRadiSam system protein A [Haloferacaceae archaeon]